jgi:hypothetical protein
MYNANGVLTVGVRNDIERATKAAENAVLTFGVSKSLGVRSYALADKSLMSAEDKAAVAAEIKSLVEESFALARTVIQNNRVVFERMAYVLLETGELDQQALEDFYARPENKVNLVLDQRAPRVSVFSKAIDGLMSWWRGKQDNVPSAPNHKISIVSSFQAPEVLASISQIIEDDMVRQQAQARQPKTKPIFEDFGTPTKPTAGENSEVEGCLNILKRSIAS